MTWNAFVTEDLHSHIVHLPVFVVVLWKPSDGRKWKEFFGAATALPRLWPCRNGCIQIRSVHPRVSYPNPVAGVASALKVFFLTSFDMLRAVTPGPSLFSPFRPALIVISQPHAQQCASSVCLSSQSSSMCGALSALVLSSFLPPFQPF